jgi:biopolymer transport protein ExbD
MAFGGFNDNRQPAPMSEINVTPMVDVMLVLLVIFIITAPLLTHKISLDLPTAQAAAAPAPGDTVTISIQGDGALYWNNESITPQALDTRLATTAATAPDTELQLRADKATRYEVIAQVMSAVQANGLSRIGFVTDPAALSEKQ